MALEQLSNQDNYVVAVEGLEALALDFNEVTDRIRDRASKAINTTAPAIPHTEQPGDPPRGRFPGPLSGRPLERAAPHPANGVLEQAGSRDRGTVRSDQPCPVRPGHQAARAQESDPARQSRSHSQIPNSFIMNLRSGNQGLAIRLKPASLSATNVGWSRSRVKTKTCICSTGRALIKCSGPWPRTWPRMLRRSWSRSS